MTDTDLACLAACERLVVASYSLMDHGKYAETAALFSNEGTWMRAGKPFCGRGAILESLQQRSPSDTSRHFVTNILVTRTSEIEAEATALFIPLRGTHDSAGISPLTPPVMVGDLYYKFFFENGKWMISHLQPRMRFKA